MSARTPNASTAADDCRCDAECIACGHSHAAAEREGEELTAEDRILMHRAFLRVVRPWEQRGVKWSLEPEYVNAMFDAVSASLRAALLAARREEEAVRDLLNVIRNTQTDVKVWAHSEAETYEIEAESWELICKLAALAATPEET